MIFNNSKTIPQEAVGSPAPTLKGNVQETAVIPLAPILPSQQYGKHQDTLDANIALRNLNTSTSSSQIVVVSSSLNSTTLDISCWFTPKLVMVEWIIDNTTVPVSKWWITATSAYYLNGYSGWSMHYSDSAFRIINATQDIFWTFTINSTGVTWWAYAYDTNCNCIFTFFE